MIINLKKFFSGDDVSIDIDYSFSIKDVEVDGCFPFVSPVRVKGKLTAFAGSAELEAVLEYDFSMPCNRCMEQTLTKFSQKVSHNLVRTLNSEEDSDSYIQVENELIDLDELLYSDIILELPVKYICKQDCKGLCPHCGVNLNKQSCHCSDNQTDPRLEILKKLIDN